MGHSSWGHKESDMTERLTHTCIKIGASLVAQMAKNLPAMQVTWVRYLSTDQEDPLEEEMATHSSILTWKISWTEKLGELQPMGLQRVLHD